MSPAVQHARGTMSSWSTVVHRVKRVTAMLQRRDAIEIIVGAEVSAESTDVIGVVDGNARIYATRREYELTTRLSFKVHTMSFN